MTKATMIEAILKSDKGYKKTGLNAMKVAEVKAIYDGIFPGADAEDKGNETPEPVVEFASGCGFPFDPEAKSDCHLECSQDNPEWYKACVANFETTAKPTSSRSTGTPRKGKNLWGHLNNSQAEMIDRFLLTEEPGTIDQIAEFAGARKPRTRHHLLHLKSQWKVKLSKTAGGQIVLDERFPDIAKLEETVEFK